MRPPIAPSAADTRSRPAIRGLQVATLTYHEITDDPRSSGFQRPAARAYRHSVQDFERHLDAFAQSPVHPALLDQVDLTHPGRHLLLTFDDGGRSALDAADALSRRGWRGHFFVVTSLLGQRGFLGSEDVRYLRSCGHLIGTHSHTHPDIFRDLSPDAMTTEWTRSCEILAELLGEPCLAGSIPGGDASRAVFRAAQHAGVRYLFTSEPILRPEMLDQVWLLGRFCPKLGTSPAKIRAVAAFEGWRGALVERRAKNALRRALPALYRLRVRSVTRE